jgi:hypothetical protein
VYAAVMLAVGSFAIRDLKNLATQVRARRGRKPA